MAKSESNLEAIARDCPAAWFFAFERARRTGDKDLEKTALENLARLGVRVDFTQGAEGVSHEPR